MAEEQPTTLGSGVSAPADGSVPRTKDASRQAELERRVEFLERRIALLEQMRGVAPVVPEIGPARVPPHLSASFQPSPVRVPPVPPPLPQQAAPPMIGASLAEKAVLDGLLGRKRAARDRGTPGNESADVALAPLRVESPIMATSPATLGYQPKPPPLPTPLSEGDLEQTIGLKWAGWIGALVVVVGAALGVKYAYDAGWFALAPPELRMALMALAGFALIGAGEIVYRKVNKASAAGLFAAGVATLFLVSYTGYGFLDVYSQNVAFVLMALTTLVGAAVAVRGQLLSVAVVALLGGHLTPLILGGDPSNLLPFLSYLLMLQAVALVLAWWGGTTRWWTLRWLALVTTALWMTPILLSAPARADGLAFTFVLVYAGLFVGELIVSAVRPRASPAVVDLGAGVVFSLAVTLALVIATMIAQQEATQTERGAWIVGYAAAYAVAGVALGRAAAGRMLAVALRTQAAALVVLAVPVTLSGSAVVLVWAGMAIVFGVVGAQSNLLISRAASAGTWLIAVIYLIVASGSPDLKNELEDVAFTVARIDVPVYVALAWALAMAGLAVAWLLTVKLPITEHAAPASAADDADEDAKSAEHPLLAAEVEVPGWSLAVPTSDLLRTARLLSVLACGLWVIASLHGLPATAATLALITFAWLLVALDYGAKHLGLAAQALAVLVLAAVKWALLDLLALRLKEGWSAAQLQYAPVLNPQMALGALIAASLVSAFWLRRREVNALLDRLGTHAASRSAALTVAGAIIVFVTLGLSLEIDRIIERARDGAWPLAFGPGQVRLLCFTILWSLATMGMAGLVIRLEPNPNRRRARLGAMSILPALLAAKYLTADTVFWHLDEGRVRGMVLLNLENVAASFVLATIGVFWWARMPPRSAGTSPGASTPRTLGFAVLLVLLLVGQCEIGRAMNYLSVAPLVRGVAISVWWSMFAIATVVAGFVTRTAGMRYFGLTLFAITLVKVFIVDMRTLDRGWRTLSFIALGLLLLGTSVLYGKYSPKLLGARDQR